MTSGSDTIIDPDTPVLVAGASGFVGSHIVRLLVQRGRKVRVLLRASSNRDALQNLPIEVVYGDVLDPASLRLAMAGCSTVFYSVVDPRFWLTDQTPIFRNNVEGVVNAMDVALELGVKRFIFTSTMGTLGLNPDGLVTEDIPFNWLKTAPPYILARREAENRLLAYCRTKGLPGVALCVANTFGPQDHQPTPHGGQLWGIASGKVKASINVSQPTVDIRDVAEAAVAAETRGRVGERYIIANEFVSATQFFKLAVAQTGLPMPKLISYRVAYAIAWVAERVSRLLGRKDSMVTTSGIYLANVFREMDNGKARRELDWNPRPLHETVRDAIAWYAQNEKQR